MFNEKLADSAREAGMEESVDGSCCFAEKAEQTLREVQAIVGDVVRSQPLAALLIAGGLGLAIGACCRRR